MTKDTGPGRSGKKASGEKHPCIWMQAGVVGHKYCRIDYDCPACHFDKTLNAIACENRKIRESGGFPKGRRGAIVYWKERLRQLPRHRQPCIHHLKRRIAFRSCTNDYHCSNCDFDQYFNDQFAVHAVVRPVEVMDIHGIKAPQGYYLHRGHAWAKIEDGGAVRIGIDDFAYRVFGPPDRIEAPLVGKEVCRDDAAMILFRGKNSAGVRMPVGGVVTDVNRNLWENGRVAADDPYAKGWVARIHATSLREDLRDLMIRSETGGFLSEEIDRLFCAIEETAGPLAADGGELGKDIYGNLPDLGWDRLRHLFLHT